jgi:IS30 family transposase
MKATVISLLEEGYCPEQIKFRSNVEGFAMVSHETIYRWIWEDKHKNGTLLTFVERERKPCRIPLTSLSEVERIKRKAK